MLNSLTLLRDKTFPFAFASRYWENPLNGGKNQYQGTHLPIDWKLIPHFGLMMEENIPYLRPNLVSGVV
jgi:hypothetical protein